MRFGICSAVSVIGLAVAGCATQGVSTYSHSEPRNPEFNFDRDFTEPQSVVWDRLVKNIATSFFVINNIDKESRILNLSYSSDRPQDYIDCGRTRHDYTLNGVTKSFEYGTTDNIARYEVATPRQLSTQASSSFELVRTAKLEGRANVYVAPEGNGTKVTVNAKSVTKVMISGDVVHKSAAGAVLLRQAATPSVAEFVAITKGATSNSVVSGNDVFNVTCYSTGKLEQNILDMAK